ncbi:MAG: hypothetical protein M3680_35690, partial [Myxococcota bacterium]|nr:hypothetical protein [Myxococcota bacterium]
MASRKRPPETSRITRIAAVAFARRQRGPGEADGEEDSTAAEAPPAPGDAPQPGDGAKSATSNDLPTTIEPALAAPAPTAEVVVPPDGEPKLGEGAKSATHNELPTEPAAEPAEPASDVD